MRRKPAENASRSQKTAVKSGRANTTALDAGVLQVALTQNINTFINHFGRHLDLMDARVLAALSFTWIASLVQSSI